MIRLVVSDLDGTLMQRGQTEISERYFSLIQDLYRQGVLFAVATGRSYGDCRRLFAPVAGKIAYIVSDGAAVFCADRLIQAFPLQRENAMSLAADGYACKDTEVLLVGQYASYCRPKTLSSQLWFRQKLHGHLRILESYGQMAEPVLMVSFCAGGNASSSQKISLFDQCAVRWQGRAQVSYAANGWLDLVAPGVDKGRGVLRLLQHLGLTPDQCAAFGDNYNDRALLQTVGHPFVMESAPEEIRALGSPCKDVEETVRTLFPQIDKSGLCAFANTIEKDQ